MERYAKEFSLPVELNSPVREIVPIDGRFRIEVDGRTLTSEQVVVATGAFQTPYVPPFAGLLASEVVQMHSTGYRRVEDIPEGRVLVVGGGNTGFQIAEELARGARRPSPDRLPADTVAPASARTRYLLVAVGARGSQQDDRDATRAASEGAVTADRFESRQGPAPASGSIRERGRRRAHDHLRRREHARRRRRDLGDRLPERLFLDRAADLRRAGAAAAPARRHRGAGAYFLGL